MTESEKILAEIAKIPDLVKSLACANANVVALQQTVNDINARLGTQISLLSSANSNIAALQSSVSGLNSQCSDLQSRVAALEARPVVVANSQQPTAISNLKVDDFVLVDGKPGDVSPGVEARAQIVRIKGDQAYVRRWRLDADPDAPEAVEPDAPLSQAAKENPAHDPDYHMDESTRVNGKEDAPPADAAAPEAPAAPAEPAGPPPTVTYFDWIPLSRLSLATS